MKTSMREICPVFNTNRMVKEYAEKYYLPAHSRYSSLTDEKLKSTKALAIWRAKIQQNWGGIKIVEVKSDGQKGMKVGESLDVHALIDLAALTPDDVTVELYHGMLNLSGEIANPTVLPMVASGKPKGRVCEFLSTIRSESSGRQGYTVRILPHHPDIDNPLKQGLVPMGVR